MSRRVTVFLWLVLLFLPAGKVQAQTMGRPFKIRVTARLIALEEGRSRLLSRSLADIRIGKSGLLKRKVILRGEQGRDAGAGLEITMKAMWADRRVALTIDSSARFLESAGVPEEFEGRVFQTRRTVSPEPGTDEIVDLLSAPFLSSKVLLALSMEPPVEVPGLGLAEPGALVRYSVILEKLNGEEATKLEELSLNGQVGRSSSYSASGTVTGKNESEGERIEVTILAERSTNNRIQLFLKLAGRVLLEDGTLTPAYQESRQTVRSGEEMILEAFSGAAPDSDVGLGYRARVRPNLIRSALETND